jgi:hypothetical protein
MDNAQFIPSGAEFSRSELLSHFPVFIESGAAKFQHIVAHAEIYIVDGTHEVTIHMLSWWRKYISLQRTIRDKPAQHNAGLLIRFPAFV